MSLSLARLASWFAVALGVACSAPPDAGSATFPDAPFARLTTFDVQLSVELRTAPAQPPVRGSSSAQLFVRDTSGAARDDLRVKVMAWMPAHGHGSPSNPSVVPLGNGLYRIDALDLPMAGIWEVRVDLSGEGGLEDHASTTIEVR